MTTRAPNSGEPAPWFIVRADCAETFHFHTVGGRYVVLSFLGSTALPESRAVFDGLLAAAGTFDGDRAALLFVTADPLDESLAARTGTLPGIRTFFDFDRAVSKLYGAAADGSAVYQRATYVLDARLRVLLRLPFTESPAAHVARVLSCLAQAATSPLEGHAPVLMVPRIFEPELCAELVKFYALHDTGPSGFMRDVNGRTELVHDTKHKVRRDASIPEGELRSRLLERIRARLVPEIQRAFQFNVTRIERHLIGCYDAQTGAHFRRHRDNTTFATAHRRFAVTINLNAGDYDGGDLFFPEFGTRTYLPPSGAALVFSCSLLHEVRKVTRGVRFAYLPFLYDDAAAAIRRANEAATRANDEEEQR